MKKFINSVDTIVSDTINSYVKVYGDRIHKVDGFNVIARNEIENDKVGIVIGNGSGHEPACIGFVGKNAIDCNAYGNIFACPGPNHILSAIKNADRGKGVVVLISNHAGDIINSKIAVDWAIEDGIDAKYVILYDDVLSATKDKISERRGTAGTFFVYKMAGAYSAKGYSADEICKMVERIRDNTRTVTLASVSPVSPITEKKMFDIPDDEYILGIGVHGESGINNLKVQPASEIAKKMSDILIQDGNYKSGEEVIVLVNGCGQTTYMELLIFYGEVEKYLKSLNIKSFKPAVGSFITTQEMGGISLSFCRADEEIKDLWCTQTDAPAFPKII